MSTLSEQIEKEVIPFIERQINTEKTFYELITTLPEFKDKEVMLANSKAFLSALDERRVYFYQLKTI